MTTPIIVTGPGGGAYATATTITNALTLARIGGGSVVLAAGIYDESLTLLADDNLVAAGPGVTIRGAHVVDLSATDARPVQLRGIRLTNAPGQTTPALQVVSAAAACVGAVRLCSCALYSEGNAALEVSCVGDAAAPPVLELDQCSAETAAAPGTPALSLGGPNVRYKLRNTCTRTAGDQAWAVFVTATAVAPFELSRCWLDGSLVLDDSAMSAGQLAGTVSRCEIANADPSGAIYAVQGVGAVVVVEDTLLDSGDAPAVSGLVVRARGDVGTTRDSRLGTAAGSGSEARPVARPRTSTWFGPGGAPIAANTVALQNFVELVVVNTAAQGVTPVTVRLPPLQEQWDGHVVEIKNVLGTSDLIVAPVAGEKLDAVASATYHVNAGRAARFAADRAGGTWLLLA